MAATGSTSGQPQFIASTGNRSFSNTPLIENPDADRIVVPDVSLIMFLVKYLVICLFSLDKVLLAEYWLILYFLFLFLFLFFFFIIFFVGWIYIIRLHRILKDILSTCFVGSFWTNPYEMNEYGKVFELWSYSSVRRLYGQMRP